MPTNLNTEGMDTTNNEARKLSILLEQYFEEFLRLFPLQATSIGDRRFDHMLSNYISDEHRSEQRAMYIKYMDKISEVHRESLDRNDRLSYDTFRWDLARQVKGLALFDREEFVINHHLMPINQFASLPLIFAQLASGKGKHPFRTSEDYDNFLSRINDFITWSETAITNMREGIALGIVQPKVLMEKVLVQFQELINTSLEESNFYKPVLDMPTEIPYGDKNRLAAAYTAAINEKIIPTYQKLSDFIGMEYLPNCRATDGLCHIPGGEEAYAYLISYWTTTPLTADEIFQIGMDEVLRIKSEMEHIKDTVGFKGDLDAFFEHLKTSPRFHPFNRDEDILNAYRAIQAKVEPNLTKLFVTIPESDYEIRATEKFRAADAIEEYEPAALDGSRQAVFYVPITDPQKYNCLRMEVLFLHEVIPGHHYQYSLQQAQQNLPSFRRNAWYGACGEGWGLYTETLGKELGLYTDPYNYFGMLMLDMHRAIRLVVDTGIHARGWTREQAIKFSLDNEGLSREKVEAEINRYMALPAQALSYKIGQLKILDLRSKAIDKLGAKFSISAFHDEILRNGVLPLDLLEYQIAEWIAMQ